MKQILLLVSAILVLLCIQGNSKPLTQDSTAADNEYENGLDLLRRITRQAAPANGNKLCKYKKGSWSACDPQTKVRTRTFTLKRGDAAVCEGQKTIRKECKGKKDKEGKKNKSRDGNGNNQQPKNNRERDRPRKKNKHADANNNNNN
ncbi:unnamed protein product [Orchesella dallaii]|uniref:Pleiotrophin/Midkine C-terminal domain-containing protein n=1 Tax=Orchesella dallaii TaxID=48710 RepID=A0ABP1PVR6_9HEXA